MATIASQIRDEIDALILAKVTGVSDVSSLFNRRLSELGIDAATSLEKLTALRETWDQIDSRDDGFTESEMLVF